MSNILYVRYSKNNLNQNSKASIIQASNSASNGATKNSATNADYATDLVFGLEDRPPLKQTLFAAFQHLLAVFVAIITPPLIIAGALGMKLEETSYLVSMALLASGISTFIQCRTIGKIGCGLLCIQGTSFSFISPIISAGLAGGLASIFGAVISASTVEMFISRVLKFTRKIITPLVSGVVVTLIGMSLIKVGITACGGFLAKENGTFGSMENLGLATIVILVTLFFNRSSNKYLRVNYPPPKGSGLVTAQS